MFVVRETKQKRMIKMMDEKTLAYIRWYFRTDSIEDDMVYIDNREITELVDGNGFPLIDMKIQKIVVENAGLTGTLKIKEGWL